MTVSRSSMYKCICSYVCIEYMWLRYKKYSSACLCYSFHRLFFLILDKSQKGKISNCPVIIVIYNESNSLLDRMMLLLMTK